MGLTEEGGRQMDGLHDNFKSLHFKAGQPCHRNKKKSEAQVQDQGSTEPG